MDNRTNLADLERENERLRKQLAELDEVPRKKGIKTVSELKDVQDMTTSVSKGIRSIPGRDDRYYLDLYLLQKERERLAKEIASQKKRRLHLGMKVSQIDEEMVEKQEKALQDMTILSTERHAKPVKEKTSGKKQKAPMRYEYKEEEWNKFTLEY
jgi:hypothetical protein